MPPRYVDAPNTSFVAGVWNSRILTLRANEKQRNMLNTPVLINQDFLPAIPPGTTVYYTYLFASGAKALDFARVPLEGTPKKRHYRNPDN